MQTFSSGREAKEYLIAQAIAEAEREGTALSEIERKMMYFTETAWTLPDMAAVSEVFDRDYNPAAYEAKIGRLARNARDRAAARNELTIWKDAVRTLQREDHYLLVLLSAKPESSNSRLTDRLKLAGVALLTFALILAGAFLFISMK
jgi:hypothetical protein